MRVSTGLSSHVSISYIIQFYFHVGTMIILLRLRISQPKYKTKFDKVMDMLFSFIKVDRRSAAIHVLPRLRPLKCHERSYGSCEMNRIYFVQSSTDECKYCSISMTNMFYLTHLTWLQFGIQETLVLLPIRWHYHVTW